MDRQLQIALVSAALALAWGYALRLQLRGTRLLPISRQDMPGLFWCVMIVLAVVEAGFVALAIMSFGGWVSARG